jgi:hypothetical protein
LIVDEEVKGEVKRVGIYCENGPTVRALNGCFGGVVESEHSVNQAAFKGKVFSIAPMTWASSWDSHRSTMRRRRCSRFTRRLGVWRDDQEIEEDANPEAEGRWDPQGYIDRILSEGSPDTLNGADDIPKA